MRDHTPFDAPKICDVGFASSIQHLEFRHSQHTLVAGEARVTYHGGVAPLCGEGAAYVGDGRGAVGPGTQGQHLDLEVNGVTLLVRAASWTGSAAYRVAGRLTPVPIPVMGDGPVLVQ